MPSAVSLQKVHESAEKAAESAAEKAVNALYTGESPPEADANPAGTSGRSSGSAKSRS